MNDFIGIYKNVLSEEFCDNLINSYNKLSSGYITNRQISDGVEKLEKDNDYTFIKDWSSESIHYYQDKPIFEHFDDIFWNQCYSDYVKNYGVLSTLEEHAFDDDLKIQKIKKGEGYHVWHCEQANRSSNSRLLLVIAYLNDVQEGGETEFLYQHKRIKPTKGTILICPGGFTHTHRGNPPISNTKYILNGWIEFRR